MRAVLEGVLLSISFFTQIPVPYHVKSMGEKTYKFLTLFLPFNGIILASLMVLFYHLLSPFANDIYVAVLASVFYLFMYGFLHLEAVADIIDAYYGSHSGKDPHVILKDAHVGSLGAIGTFALIVVKVAALSVLLVDQAYFVLFALFFLSRLMVVGVIYGYEFHKASKFIHNLKKPLDQTSIVALLFIALVLLAFLGELHLLFFALVVTYLVVRWLLKRIGFLNGDGLGFLIEINELILLNVVIFL
ncbi:MAG: adenosylcobinamide-GDP ribazoletransferase [Epsilonproteobacteria bacterium]|nr:adenosylcobinamide-GDP ribazoletransferase [Campylobacterota bacterium]